VFLVERMTGDLMAELGYAPITRTGGLLQFAAILPTMALEWLRGGLAWRLRKVGDAMDR
jgi:hypothetical protein